MLRPNAMFGLVFTILAVLGAGAVGLDWPSPDHLAGKRLQYAALLLNAVDKSFDPATVRQSPDVFASYEQLRSRYGASPEAASAFALADTRYERLNKRSGRDAWTLCLSAAATALIGAFLARTLALHRKTPQS